MRNSEAKQGRTFVIRLEDGEIVHKEIEQLAKDHSIKAAALIVVGGADKGSKLVDSTGIRALDPETGFKFLNP